MQQQQQQQTLDELKYRSWALGRQLKAIYSSLQLEKTTKEEEEEEEDDAVLPRHEQLVRLRATESVLRKQIGHLLDKLPGAVASTTKTTPQADDKDDKGGEGRASEALRRFLVSSGGERGGWDERDHALFLQWRSRFRNNRQTFISAVCDTVPGKNKIQVEAHERFYQQLLRLRNEQRLEIDEWRREKKSRQEEERKRVRLEDSETPEEMDRWLTEWKKQRKVIEEKIDRWKKEKMAAAEAAAAAEAMAAEPSPFEVKKAQMDQKRRMEQQYQRLVAYLWRAEQEAVAERARRQLQQEKEEEKKKRKNRSASCHQLLREKQQNVEKHWIETRRRPTPPPPPSRPPSSASSGNNSIASRHRDPKRLLKPTSASMARYQIQDESKPYIKPYILDVTTRTVPTWRRRPSAGS